MKRKFAPPLLVLALSGLARADSTAAIVNHGGTEYTVGGDEHPVVFSGGAAACLTCDSLTGTVAGLRLTATFSSLDAGGKDADPLVYNAPGSGVNGAQIGQITTAATQAPGNDDTSIDDLTIRTSRPFHDLLIDIFGVFDGSNRTPVQIAFSDGTSYTTSLWLTNGTAARNYLEFVAPSGKEFSSISFGVPNSPGRGDGSPARFYAADDIYFSPGNPPAPAPEPSSLALLGTGLLGGLGAIRRKCNR